MKKQSIHKLIKDIDSQDISVDEKLTEIMKLVSNQYTDNYRLNLMKKKLQKHRLDHKNNLSKETLLNIIDNVDITDNQYLLMYLCNQLGLRNYECLIKKVNSDYVITETEKKSKSEFIYKNTEKNCYTLILNNYDRFGYGSISIDITDNRFYKIVDCIGLNKYIVNDKTDTTINNRTTLNTYRLSVYKKYTKKEVGGLFVKKVLDYDNYVKNIIDGDIVINSV